MLYTELSPVQRDDLQKYLENTSSPRNIIRTILTVLTVLTMPFGIMLLDITVIFGVYWMLLPFAALWYWIKGWNRDFGRKAPSVCLRKGEFTCSRIIFKEKVRNEKGQPPYRILSADDMVYECPHYLDYRDAHFGDTFIAVRAGNKGYAFAENREQGDLTDPAYNMLVPEDAPDFTDEKMTQGLR